jgi:hypothetical protein
VILQVSWDAAKVKLDLTDLERELGKLKEEKRELGGLKAARAARARDLRSEA